MLNQGVSGCVRCDHCRGSVRTDRTGGSAYSCDACGCGWDGGMILARKGQGCPVHGREVMRAAVLRIVQRLLEPSGAQPTPTPF
jgi:hypothetical protein